MRSVQLDDKYSLEEGRVYMTGTQALVRLPMLQRDRDRAAGLNTAGFVTGYRGSPLGGYDEAMRKASKHLDASNVRFHPGLNEDIAATSVWGTQQVALLPEATVEGVFGIWYGKGPGVDRTADVFKHANAAGTSPKGGVIAIMGDDHGCQSSTLPHQSEQIMAACMIPVLNPANIQEIVDFGLYGFALSRFSGCWVGLKATTEVVEASATVDIDPRALSLTPPTEFVAPDDGLGIRWPDTPLDQERRLHGPKMAAVAAFARANPIDRTIWRPDGARLGIVTTGKSYTDVRQALDDLGVDDAAAARLGIALYKVGMTWPLEQTGARNFALGLETLLVIEEKRSFIEEQLSALLINETARPLLVGKHDEVGNPMLNSAGELDPAILASVIVGRLARIGAVTPEIEAKLAAIVGRAGLQAGPATLVRTAFFCSGCPHNSSTVVPEGRRAMAGIGCHGMAYSIPERRTSFITQMGGEGATWIGQAPFTTEEHVFQNLGDGTYFHSGLLAIRAAAAANVNITYKILFNDAVAMTGGQMHDGELNVPAITRQVAGEGAKRIVVVTDEPEKYDAVTNLAPGVEVRHRDDLDFVQRELRETKGLSVLVYDQTCAAEKRRRRKRNLYPDPPKRLFINDLVCEGCGDCSVKSNCISVKPLETKFGRKRVIDQSDCNKDYGCLKGFCPSFVTVKGGQVRRGAVAKTADPGFDKLPMPVVPALTRDFNILVTGIGGTGVITIGALLGMAAHLEGLRASVLDFTGLAQKNGGVMSHVRLSPDTEELHAVRIGSGATDLLLACDLVVAASPAGISRIDAGRTAAVVNARVTPTAAFVRDGKLALDAAIDRKRLSNALGDDAAFIDATGLATALTGDSIATNLFMLGFAWQRGQVPLSFEALDRAIELNAVAVAANRRAFAWGRLAAHDMSRIDALVTPAALPVPVIETDLDALVADRANELTRYQNAGYADRYRATVALAAEAERRLGAGENGFALAVARYLFKLMAYKDEYEVARLYTDGRFAEKLRAQFDGDYRLEFNLAPPIFAKRDPVTGHLRKRAFGPWMMQAFRLLARAKSLRGTALDPFGRTAERRNERAMIADYEQLVRHLSATLTPTNHAAAVDLAALPDAIRGYGHIKDASVNAAAATRLKLLAAFEKGETAQAIAAE